MREMFILGICAFIGLVVVWTLLQAFRTGRISSRGWTFEIDKSPMGFCFVALGNLVLLAGCILFALYTVGWDGQLPPSLRFGRH